MKKKGIMKDWLILLRTNDMDNKRKLVLYLRHISFILFLLALIILYSSFEEFKYGQLCLIVSLIYIFVTFVMFFIKNKDEESNIFNNFVLCFLHTYICFVAYKYYLIKDFPIISNSDYFSFNLLMISVCMSVLCINKIIIAADK